MRIACGEPLPFAQEDITLRGHAIECRIYAEDPDNNFFPSPGRILDWRVPAGPGIRFDDGVYGGWTVPNEYDPMLGKLIASGKDRVEAIARLQRALTEFYANGIKTNAELFQRILATRDFQSGEIYTRWLDDFLSGLGKGTPTVKATCDVVLHEQDAATIAAALWQMSKNADAPDASSSIADAESRWKREARREQLRGELDQ